MKNKNITLLAFATLDLKRSIQRLKMQALESNYYDDIKIITSKDLDPEAQIFINKILKNNGKRGYGYWFWKPYLILKTMNNLHEKNIIHYVDIGCHINNFGNNKFENYISILDDDDVNLLAFQYYPLNDKKFSDIDFPKREEFKHTKADLLDYFQFLNNKKITHSPQFWAGSFFIKKSKFSISFVKEWLDVFEKNFHLINDSPSKLQNLPGFLGNRHDQSVFSLLCKKNFIKSLSAYECDWAIKNNERTWDHAKYNPFLAKRDLKYNFFKRFINRQKRTFNRLKKKINYKF